MSREIKIKVRQVEYQGKKFNAFKAVLQDGTMIDAKFTREVDPKLIPSKSCVLIVPEGKCNVSYKKEYPVLWIAQVSSIKDVVTSGKSIEEELTEMFGPSK